MATEQRLNKVMVGFLDLVVVKTFKVHQNVCTFEFVLKEKAGEEMVSEFYG